MTMARIKTRGNGPWALLLCFLLLAAATQAAAILSTVTPSRPNTTTRQNNVLTPHKAEVETTLTKVEEQQSLSSITGIEAGMRAVPNPKVSARFWCSSKKRNLWLTEELKSEWQNSHSPVTNKLSPLARSLMVKSNKTNESNEQNEAQVRDMVAIPEMMLPADCNYMERINLHSVLCSGHNITKIPSFPLAQQVKSLHFDNTRIQTVTNVSGLPRSLQVLAFTSGNLGSFNGVNFYKLKNLTTLMLDYNSLSTWSFSTFNVPTNTYNATITYISLRNNLITYPPDPFGYNATVLPSLEVVDMSNNPICNLPGKLFVPLTSSPVTALSLRNCSLTQFYAHPLEPLKGLRILDLSSNMGLSTGELEVLLDPLKDEGVLQELYLSNNNYGSVPTNALALVNSSLEVLDLHGSAFECLDNTSFPVMPQLLHLNLKYCRINNIRPGTFQGFLVLEELNLDGNGLVTIPTEVLLPSLKVLTMSENPRTTGTGSPESFTMDQVDFARMTSLTNITFQQVPLGGVEASYFNDLHGLLDLRLSQCNIEYIQAFSFVNLSLLQHLYLDNNKLRVLHNDTFVGLVSLITLDLSHNNIIFHANVDYAVWPLTSMLIPDILVEEEEEEDKYDTGVTKTSHSMADFKKMHEERHFEKSNKELDLIISQPMGDLRNFHEDRRSDNANEELGWTTSDTEKDLQNTSEEGSLDNANEEWGLKKPNKGQRFRKSITNRSSDMTKKAVVLEKIKEKTVLKTEERSMTMSLEKSSLANVNKDKRSDTSRIEAQIERPHPITWWVQEEYDQVLHKPQMVKETAKTVDDNTEINHKDSIAYVITDNKTEVDTGGHLLNVSRGYTSLYLPFEGLRSLRHLDLTNNDIWTVVPAIWRDLEQLISLKLGFNNIQEWYNPAFTKLTNMTELFLPNNALTIITDAMVEDFNMKSLSIVDLSTNPFKCGCNIINFNATLNASLFMEYPKYRCKRDEEMLSFSEYIVNNTCFDSEASIPPGHKRNIPTLEVILITSSILVSIVMTSAAIYKKRWYIRYLVHTARLRSLSHKSEAQHYHYDTFVCYSQADRQWVFEHLVAKLEDGGRYRVCVHERDFTVGQEITENIISSVEKSRKVVMVLSPAFVKSSWCMFELQLASNKILDERKNKLILILLTPLSSQNQPKKLRLLLRTRTYLPWAEDSEGQRLFWVRLLRAVAKPTVSEAPDVSTYL